MVSELEARDPLSSFTRTPSLRLVHFNDVYNVLSSSGQPERPVLTSFHEKYHSEHKVHRSNKECISHSTERSRKNSYVDTRRPSYADLTKTLDPVQEQILIGKNWKQNQSQNLKFAVINDDRDDINPQLPTFKCDCTFVGGPCLEEHGLDHGAQPEQLKNNSVNEESKEPIEHLIGGASRFVSLINEYRERPTLSTPPLTVCFSGDIFSPSLESTFSHGKHMLRILKLIGVDVACLGNHEFDFGVDQLKELMKGCNFPWLASNVTMGTKDGPALADAGKYHIQIINGIKIGYMGLIEEEWLETVPVLPPNIVYQDFVEIGLQYSNFLRYEKGCDMIICLTHMREHNDIKLAESLPRNTFDLILGGHDHFYSHLYRNGVNILCSGTDFRNLTYIEAFKDFESNTNFQKWHFTFRRRDITEEIQPDLETEIYVKSFTKEIEKSLNIQVGYSYSDLETRFNKVRTEETNFGNFVCDFLCYFFKSEISLIPGGTFRSDRVFNKGIVYLKTFALCFPYEDPHVVLRIPGSKIIRFLENSVSRLPAMDGRFSQIGGGLRFKYTLADHKNKIPAKILSVTINGEPLDLTKKYSVLTRGYTAKGKDGYDCLVNDDNMTEDEKIIEINPFMDENGNVPTPNHDLRTVPLRDLLWHYLIVSKRASELLTPLTFQNDSETNCTKIMNYLEKELEKEYNLKDKPNVNAEDLSYNRCIEVVLILCKQRILALEKNGGLENGFRYKELVRFDPQIDGRIEVN